MAKLSDFISSGSLAVSALGQVSTNQTLDLNAASVFELRPTADIQIDVTGLATGGRAECYLTITNGGAQTLTWGGNIKWAGGAAPSLSVGEGYNISGMSYNSTYFGFEGPSHQPLDLAFDDTGTKLFVMEYSDKIAEYSLSTAWDISTATHVTTHTYHHGFYSISFFDNGNKYVSATPAGDNIFVTALSAPYDVSSYETRTFFDVSPKDNTAIDAHFNNDGTKVFFSGRSSESIHQYTLTTPYDITTATYDNVSYDVSTSMGDLWHFEFNATGTRFYATNNHDSIYQFDMSTAFDLSTASYNSVRLDTGTLNHGNDVRGFKFKTDGTKLYFVDSSTAELFQYSLSTAFDLSTATYDNKSLVTKGPTSRPTDIAFNLDGTKMFVADDESDNILSFNLSTPYDITTRTGVLNTLELVNSGNIWCLEFNNDGSKLFVLNNSYDRITEYPLSTPFDLSSAGTKYQFDVSTEDLAPSSFTFDETGTKLFMVGKTNDLVFQYNLTTAFDLSTASDSGIRFDPSPLIIAPTIVKFVRNGTAFWLSDVYEVIYEYNVSTAYDITTAQYSGKSFSVTDVGVFYGVTFNPDGTKVYLGGSYSGVGIYDIAPSEKSDTITLVQYGSNTMMASISHQGVIL